MSIIYFLIYFVERKSLEKEKSRCKMPETFPEGIYKERYLNFYDIDIEFFFHQLFFNHVR